MDRRARLGGVDRRGRVSWVFSHPQPTRWPLAATTGAPRVVGMRYGATAGSPMAHGMRYGLNVGNSMGIKRNENYFRALTFGVLTVNESLQYPK